MTENAVIKEMTRMDKKKILARVPLHVLTAVYGAACLWLYYRQSVAGLSVEGSTPFQSDLPLHISMVIEDNWYYSFTAYAYRLLHLLFGGGTVGIAAFLALVSVATIYGTEILVCRLAGKKEKSWVTLLLALSLNFVMPVYVRFVGEFRYVSYQSANVWHNSTYLCMKLVAILALSYYFKLAKEYDKGISFKEWACFALLNVLCTGIKPSFLLAFSPVMGIFLLADLVRGVKLKNVLVFGSALLPSGIVILWQNAVLFGEDTGNGISLQPWFTFSLHASIPKLAVVCSALFCILVIGVTFLREYRDRSYRFILYMALVGFLEALCLVESGNRSVDGNFLWGYGFCLFALFTLCGIKWVWMKECKGRKVIWVILGVIYGWHLYCGLYFFLSLVTGESFWMR